MLLEAYKEKNNTFISFDPREVCEIVQYNELYQIVTCHLITPSFNIKMQIAKSEDGTFIVALFINKCLVVFRVLMFSF